MVRERVSAMSRRVALRAGVTAAVFASSFLGVAASPAAADQSMHGTAAVSAATAAATSGVLRLGEQLGGGQEVEPAAGGFTLPAAVAASRYAGTWRAYGNTNPITSSASTWGCGGSHAVASGVVAQTCAIRSPDLRSVQGAVIVRNNRSSFFTATAKVSFYTTDYEGDWVCSASGVGANSWSVCFTRTFTGSPVQASASGYVNGVAVGGGSV